MTESRTIAVVTGSRSEFGLLRPVMRTIAEHEALALRVVVAGLHLVTGTWRDVVVAGFEVDARVRMQRRGHVGRAEDARAVGRGIEGVARALDTLRPDVVLVLGDRIEAFAAASAASIGGWHVAHLHGGDRAEGVADEAMRHAISKLAHLHFPATAASRRRLIRMGEHRDHVIRVGSPAVDGLLDVEPSADAPEIIVLQHPVGDSDFVEAQHMRQTLEAVSGLVEAPDRITVLMPNGDPGSKGIRAAIASGGVRAIEHLPRHRFLGLLAGCRAIVGNSSAGLIEAAVLRRPAVNVGPRQAGREKPANVIDCVYGVEPVRAALRRAFELDLTSMRHPYGRPGVGRRIADHLARLDLDTIPLRKQNAY